MKKKILVISPFFYPHIGGSQQYIEEIYAQMIKNHKDIQIYVLCYNTDKSKSYDKYRGLNIFRISYFNILPGQFALPNPISLFNLFKTRQFDLIHCSTRFFDSSWWGPIYAKIIGKKIILTDHCATFPVHLNRIISLLSKVIDFATSSIFLNFYDQIYSTNQATKKFITNTFHKNSKVIYGGIDFNIFKPKFVKNNQKTTVLFVGRMIPSKGALLLFNLAKKYPNLDFIFAGPGPLIKNLEFEIKDLKLANIKILGPQTKLEVAKLMRKTDILIHPSFHHEGFPNVLTEAGASGLAVIATDVGGSKEIIINNKTGLLIKPNSPADLEDALIKLLNKTLRDKLAKDLYSHVKKNFDWKKSSELLYREIKKLTT